MILVEDWRLAQFSVKSMLVNGGLFLRAAINCCLIFVKDFQTMGMEGNWGDSKMKKVSISIVKKIFLQFILDHILMKDLV